MTTSVRSTTSEAASAVVGDKLGGKVALVTGGTRGIGAAISASLASRVDPIAVLARPALSWIFVQGGFDAIRTPAPRAKMAAQLMNQMRSAAPAAMRTHLPDDVKVVQINAGMQIIAGVTLAIGVLPRISALALAASMVPTTVGGHAFWRIDDPVQRGPQRIQFAKNAAIVGGLLLAATRRTPG
jgi:putative oxidoreductase